MTFSSNISSKPVSTACYLRVSTVDQDLGKFRADVLKYANDNKLGSVVFIEEKISGRIPWEKRKLKELIDSAEKGDHIISPELSRLSRSTLELPEIANACKKKGVTLHLIKERLILDGSQQSEAYFMMLSIFAGYERDLISMRTREALQALKASGKTLGRPKGLGKSKLDPFTLEIHSLLSNGSTQRFIADRYGVTPVTLHLWLKKHPIEENKLFTKVRATVINEYNRSKHPNPVH